MFQESRKLLSADLRQKLEALGSSLDRKPDSGLLTSVLEELGSLPAKTVVTAGREIAWAAGLAWWRSLPQFSWLLPLRSHFSERDILKKDARFAWLFLFHYDGHIRETALRAIAGPPTTPFYVAAIIARLNDWADPVRAAAMECARRVLPLADPEAVASAALFLLDHRFVWGRWGKEQRAVLDELFGTPQVAESIAELVGKGATGALATTLGYALRYPAMDRHLQALAENAVQPAVRAVAYSCLLSGKSRWPAGIEWEWTDKVFNKKKPILVRETRDIDPVASWETLLENALKDRSGAVRRVAADAVIANRCKLGDLKEITMRLSRDKKSSVRERADFLLRHLTS